MSYPLPTKSPDEFIETVSRGLRRPSIEWDGTASVANFYPDLSPAEQAAYADLVRLHRSRLGITPVEYAALHDDFVGLRAFVNLATPTAAQTTAAVKALIRVLRAVLD